MLGYLDALAFLDVFISAGGYSSPPIEMLFREDFAASDDRVSEECSSATGISEHVCPLGTSQPCRYFSVVVNEAVQDNVPKLVPGVSRNAYVKRTNAI
jgi:hypothetical protein